MTSAAATGGCFVRSITVSPLHAMSASRMTFSPICSRDSSAGTYLLLVLFSSEQTFSTNIVHPQPISSCISSPRLWTSSCRSSRRNCSRAPCLFRLIFRSRIKNRNVSSHLRIWDDICYSSMYSEHKKICPCISEHPIISFRNKNSPGRFRDCYSINNE